MSKLKNSGVIRRISGILRHRRIGYVANGMCCFAAPPERIDWAGETAAETECDDYQVFFSTREFKKERVKYFGGEM